MRNVGTKSKANQMHMQEAQIYTDKNVFCKDNAMNSIKYWESLAENTDLAFEKALDIFSEICVNCADSDIRNACDILVENVTKVRDQSQLQRSLKYRMGVMKRKTLTKNNRLFTDISEKLHSTVNNLSKSLDAIRGGASSGVSSSSSSGGVASNPDDNNDTVEECFNALYEECIAAKECDRIVENYNKLSKIFNFDRIVTEVYRDSDSYDACLEIAKCIDTCNTSFKVRYNTALETAAYVFDKHHMNYPKHKIAEAVTDYFIFSGQLKESQIDDVVSIMEKSVYFNDDDFDIINDYIYDDIEDSITETHIDDIYIATLAENYGVPIVENKEEIKKVKKEVKQKKKEIKKKTKSLINAAREGHPEEHKDDDIKDMIIEFRRDCIKDKSKEPKAIINNFRTMLSRIYSKSPEQIVYELPDIFSVFRVMVAGVGFAINPVIGLVVLIGNYLVTIGVTRKQLEKAIASYNKEIDTAKDKVKNATDKETKDRYTRYLNQLKKDLEKLEAYEREQYTDDENDERDEKKFNGYNFDEYDFDGDKKKKKKDSDDDDDDDDFDDLDYDDIDWDDDLTEAAYAIMISDYVTSISEQVSDSSVEGIVYDNIFKLSNDSIDDLTDFAITVPVILERDKVREALEHHRDQLRHATGTKDYARIDCLNENIYKLNTAGASYNTSNTARDAVLYLSCLNEITKIGSNNVLMEMEFGNTIKLALNRLKKSAVNLSDKEKKASQDIDVAATNVVKGIENTLMTNNREAVLRGSLLPSLSKCIKIALSFGAAWIVNPTVAVISAVGAFACSKKLQKKERQLILDDIDIELKMCERYMRLAEDKNDMKAIRQIETIQRNLQRQQQRIKYKMVTVYNQKLPPKLEHDD
jgi:hypothetical protein